MFAPKVSKPQPKAATSSTRSLSHQRSKILTHRLGHGSIDQAFLLQRSIGNQATLRLLAQQPSRWAGTAPGSDPAPEMRAPDPTFSITTASPQISRKCAACEEEKAPSLQTKPIATLQPPAVAPGVVHEVLRSPGQPLNSVTREG